MKSSGRTERILSAILTHLLYFAGTLVIGFFVVLRIFRHSYYDNALPWILLLAAALIGGVLDLESINEKCFWAGVRSNKSVREANGNSR